MKACPPWCNGSTSDFGSDGPGSNPGGGAAGRRTVKIHTPPLTSARDISVVSALRGDQHGDGSALLDIHQSLSSSQLV
jgi:hypothetical protein